MAEWFSMGGYAGYVWAGYGLSFLALLGLGLLTLRRHARAKARLKAIQGK